MAIGHIFHVSMGFENPSGASSAGLYYLQTADNATSVDECADLANGFHDANFDAILDSLSDDWYFAALTVIKVFGNPRPKFERTGKGPVAESLGRETGPGLPAECASLFELQQETFGLRSHGKFYLPGIPEPQCNGNVLGTTYQTVTLQALATLLMVPVDAPSDTGQWGPIVISAKVRDVALPAKDWAGAIAPITGIVPQGPIAIQRRRSTRVPGTASVV